MRGRTALPYLGPGVGRHPLAHRHELFDEAFQSELGLMYGESALGHPPVPPAQLALATIPQAHTGASDDEVIEATVMDRRWQLVLDCMDVEHAPFSKGTLVTFRQRLIERALDRRLIERTVELAAETKAVGGRQLRAALDSSPLWGAGRVEDTYNLLGHALRKALGVIARQQGRGLTEVAVEVQTPLLGGERSLKATLDCNWDDPAERTVALEQVLAALTTVEGWLDQQTSAQTTHEQRSASLRPYATKTWRCCRTTWCSCGVAWPKIDGSASRTRRCGMAARVGATALMAISGTSCAISILGWFGQWASTPANAPEASVTDDLTAQEIELREIHLDRGYLASELVRNRPENLTIYCKAWPVRNGDRYAKTAFVLDWEAGTIRCPNQVSIPFHPDATVHFPEDTCQVSPLRERCTTSASGRSVHIHPDERLLQELRERQLTPQGRTKLRERVPVEHALAHIGRWQGRRARYRVSRKNLFELRRCAVVHNLHAMQHLPPTQAA